MSHDLHAGRIDGGVIMFKDPIVEEVRAARQRHSARFNHDLKAIVADFKKKQAHLDRPVVSLAPKKPRRMAS
jgi:hypothetical protein